MADKRLKPAKTSPLISPELARGCLMPLIAVLLHSCAPAPKTEDNAKSESSQKTDTADLDSEAGIDDMEEVSTKARKNKAPKPKLSSMAAKTGTMVDCVVMDQRNEFLGLTKVKLSKLGARIESANIVVIMQPGKGTMAYNAANGNCLQLTKKSAAMLAGQKDMDMAVESKHSTKKLDSEKLAGLDCNHYLIEREFVNKKTKAVKSRWATEVWAAKNSGVPQNVIKDFAEMSQMPADLGLPLRIERDLGTTAVNGVTKRSKRIVIDTDSYSKAKVDKAEFQPLSGYKLVTDEMQLMVTDDDSELVNSELDDLDDGKIR
ncbi:MAG: hypothetical protein K2X27_19860 [Candidatus Obscuribacterales bacterium]|nr:hypothetical protein [Candidatus Obscuribacterales bacterium]